MEKFNKSISKYVNFKDLKFIIAIKYQFRQ